MKTTVVIVRLLLRLMYLSASVVFFLKLAPEPEMAGPVEAFMEGVSASVYLLPLIKATELLCGIAFLSNRFAALAAVIIAPVTINILLFHLFLAPEGLPVAIALFLGNIFLGYAYREKYEPLLTAK